VICFDLCFLDNDLHFLDLRNVRQDSPQAICSWKCLSTRGSPELPLACFLFMLVVRAVSGPRTTASMGSSDSSTAQLVQAMAGFGGNSATAPLNTAPLGADASQQAFLTTPQHA
jgi:hypothetical protein